ncbi:hypothetical protein SAMN02910370_02899 [Lachnospiraceae bacterium XPB1003]|nr:hypothetical protein SAMN02910370_02899 [Lachnospiraceae bacterium XPB1003]
MKNKEQVKKKIIILLCLFTGLVIYTVAGTLYYKNRAKDFVNVKLKNVVIKVPNCYFSEDAYHSEGIFVIDNSQCTVIAIDLDNISERDKEVCRFIDWDKADYFYKAKNENDVAFAIELFSPMFSYHRYNGGENKHTLKKYCYIGEYNGPGQIMYYTTTDPDTHVLYAIFDHDEDDGSTSKENIDLFGCVF